MKNVFLLTVIILLGFSFKGKASDTKKINDEIKSQPAAPAQTAGIRLQSIEQVANSVGHIDQFIYKGEVTAAAETLLVDPTGFNSLIDGASLSSVSGDDFGQFYISQGGTTDLWQMLRWMPGVWSPMYELRFGGDSAGIAIDYFNTRKIYFVPFTAWDLNGTLDDPYDDRQLIPLTLMVSGDENPEWGIVDTIASSWELNPAKESSWIYLCNPANSIYDLWDVYWEQMDEGIVDYDRLDQILDEGLLRRITINSLDDNPLTTVNSINGLYRPAEGTIIRWTYSMPQKSVTFRVNMRDQLLDGSFKPQNGDIVVLRGNFNGWGGEDQVLTSGTFNDSIYHITYDLAGFAEDTVMYKFVIHQSDNSDIWEDPPPANRNFVQKEHPQTLPVFYFSTDNRITFRVDMSVQISLGNFDPLNDQVLMSGKFNDWHGIDHVLTDSDGDQVYTIEFDVGLHADELMNYGYRIRKPTGDIIYEDKGDPNDPPWHNRKTLLTGFPQTLPVVYFNNETLFNSVTIQDIQQVSDPAVYDTSSLYGDTVRVQALVMTSVGDIFSGSGTVWAIYGVDPVSPQSPWSGIRISLPDSTIGGENFKSLEPGMICEFTGIVSEFYNDTRFSILSDPFVPVNIISSDNPFPEPKLLQCSDISNRADAEQWESMWVRVENATITNNNLEGNAASMTDTSSAESYLGNTFNWFRLKLTEGTYAWPNPGTLLNVNGFLRDHMLPFGNVFSVNPRTESDIEIIPQQLSVQVLSPNGDEVWNEDYRHSIEWQASSNTTNIEIHYSIDNGQNYSMIVDTTVNDGMYRWLIPRDPSTTCRVKVVAYDMDGNYVADESDGTFTIEDVQTYVYQTGTLNHTIRNDGMSGNTQIFSGSVPDEPSLEFPPNSGNHHMYSSQLLVATVTSIDTVTTLLYGDNFLPAQPLAYEEHGTYWTTNTIYTDKLDLGLAVEEQTFVVVDQPAVIFSYKITNQGTQTYSNFYLAFFSDFDINEFRNNLSGYDSANRLAYMWDATGGWTSYAGVRLLNKDPRAFHRRAIYVDASNYPGYIYNKLSVAGYDDTSGDPQDEYSILLSAGPYTLQPGASITDAFALLAGNDLDELKQTSQNIQTFWVDTQVPLFSSVTTNPLNATLNQSFDVRADVSDDRGILEVILHYRQGGSLAFTTTPMSFTGSYYEATVPATTVTTRGVEYYVSAKDLSNNYNASASHMVQVNIPANSLSSMTLAGGTAERAYTMISTPVQFEDARFTNVLDELGAYDKKQWRLHNDTGNQMQEYPAFSNMERGKAYWIITRNTSTINFPSGRTASEDNYFASLPTGWTQIGLPCNYNVLWGDIGGITADIDGPFYYNNGNYTSPNILEPFRGYYVHNNSGSTATIHFPLYGNGASVSKQTVSAGWKIPILARIGDARDELNIIGASPDASDGKDQYDHLEPPPIGNYISVYFPHADWKPGVSKYSVDIRAESQNGYVWDMDVHTNISDKQVELSFEKLFELNLPADFNFVVIDPETRTAHFLENSPVYTFHSPGVDKTKSLRLIVGTHDFISLNNLGINTVPGSFELRQNYPNPFNPVTTITFGIPRSQPVSLIIYNMLGEEVCVLLNQDAKDAGYHTVQWDGRNKHGDRVSSGIYFYQLRGVSTVKTRKMIIVR